MKRLLLLLALFACTLSHAQLLRWSPPFVKEANAAQTLTITVDAAKGNKGLLNHAAGDVYVHIGVITSLSSGASDWKYSKFAWATTPAEAKATTAGAGKWTYTINGSLRSFFGITNTTETIQKIAILFRSGNGNAKQANSDGSDMYIPVSDGSLAVRITDPYSEPRYVPQLEQQTWKLNSTFTLAAAASRPANLALYHNGAKISAASNATEISVDASVVAEGQQVLVAEAVEAGVTRRDTVRVFVAPTALPTAALPAGVRDGINYEPGDTSATLVLFAPGKSTVSVLGDFNGWVPDVKYIMNKTPDGQRFWLRLTGLTQGTEYAYQYLVDNTLRIADYYTEKVLDPWNDQYISATTYPGLKAYPTGKTTGIVSVLQTRKPAYNWAVQNFSRPDKRSLVIYELHLRDFVAAHDWNTLVDTISYLKRLGVNAIELMPFNEFEGNNSWGYNSSFYFAPDKYYGTANSLKRFVDSAHANGMAVIMDMVLNHSFGQSPMVQLYANSNGEPTEANPWFNADQNPSEAGYQGKHPFGVGYDFNHDAAPVRYFTGRVVEHWLREYKLDGFRFDLSKGFTQKYTGNDVGAWSAYDADRVALWKGYYDTVQQKSASAYVILEHLSENKEERELADYGMMFWGNMSHNYQEAAMGYLQNSNLEGGLHTARTWSKPHLITYMESHDEERIVYKNVAFGNSAGAYNVKSMPVALKRMELNAAFLLTQPGPKMIWQFGELGYDVSINRCEDGTIKDDCRTAPKPIRWEYYSDAARRSVYDVYAKMIGLRMHPSFRQAFMGGLFESGLGGGFKWQQLLTDSSKVVTVGNFDVAPLSGSVSFPGGGTWYNLLDGTPLQATGQAQSFTLQPGEYRVYINRNLSQVAPPPPPPVAVTDFDVSAFPNPAVADVQVKISNPEAGRVTVRLYNAMGQWVATLQDGVLAKGTHVLTFNRRGLAAGSGMYYLKAVSNTGSKTIDLLFH